MSAKKARPVTPSPAHTAQPGGVAAPSSVAATSASETLSAATPWIESADPRKRQIAKIILAAVWVYVAALALLALDQTFNWGIFGP